ncbi:MAG: HD domain-containing phosphohydrolase, partial [Pseudomonadales bacterium]
ATTAPYLYFFVKKVGVTITQQSHVAGTVIAADMSLDDLSITLANNLVTPSSELVLFDKRGKVIAYKDPQKMVETNDQGDSSIASIDSLGSAVLAQNADLFSASEQVLDFEFSGEQWGGSINKLEISDDFQMYFGFVAPHSELFAKAIDIRWQSSLIAVLLIFIALPITWYSAYKVAAPLRRLTLQTRKIRQFDFSGEEQTVSAIKEIDGLAADMEEMKKTIGHFLSMIKALAGERNLDSLLETITKQTLDISRADAVVLYLLQEEGRYIEPACVKLIDNEVAKISLDRQDINESDNFLSKAIKQKRAEVHNFKRRAAGRMDVLNPFFEQLETSNLQVLTLPLNNRSGEVTGLLCVINDIDNHRSEDLQNPDRIGFMQTLSGFAAVSMESRHMLQAQKDLMNAFIKLIAGAIDAKSAHTAGHCQRVPELTKMLAAAACEEQDEAFKDYTLTEEQWEELDIAAWLHDCGKVTTPEYVVDKATKLETIYDRIHEVRMRFELIKRDCELEYWKLIAEGADEKSARERMREQHEQLDEEFAFIASCNLGQEFMSEESVQRLNTIAQRTWRRTLSDRLGISWEEELRKQREVEPQLPVMEPLLGDRVDHVIERRPQDVLSANNRWGFNMHSPEKQYNRGEIYNLSIQRGTLNDEERFKINEHIIQTIKMLDTLPFPKHLRNVPEIAGGHHEKMDGTGYPKRLTRDQMSVSARMVAVADIFEALTASDRPYKKAKKLSEAIQIMHYMKRDNHIDPDIFDLFLSSGVYLEYTRRYLSPDQIDFVDIKDYLHKQDVGVLKNVAS